MAARDGLTNTLNVMTDRIFSPELVTQVFTPSPFWTLCLQHLEHASGDRIEGPVEIAKLNGGAYQPGGTLTLTTPEIASEWSFPWSYYYVPIKLTAQDIDLNRDAAKRKLVDLLGTYVKNAGTTMIDRWLSPDVFSWHTNWVSGTSIETMSGVLDMCQDQDYEGVGTGQYATGYGGITVAAVPTWRAHVLRATGGTGAFTAQPCTVEIIQSFMDEIMHGSDTIADMGSGQMPDVIVTSKSVFSALKRELTVRGYQPGVSLTRKSEALVAAGFTNFEIDGVPVIVDQHIPVAAFDATEVATIASANNGHPVYFINFDHFKPTLHPTWDMKFDEWLKTSTIHEYINRMFTWIQFTCDKRKAQGAIYNVDPTVLYDSS